MTRSITVNASGPLPGRFTVDRIEYNGAVRISDAGGDFLNLSGQGVFDYRRFGGALLVDPVFLASGPFVARFDVSDRPAAPARDTNFIRTIPSPTFATEPDPYAAYYGPGGEAPGLILDFHNQVYARRTENQGNTLLSAIADVTTFITGWTARVDSGDGVFRMRTSDGDLPSLPPSNFLFNPASGTAVAKWRTPDAAAGDVVFTIHTDANNRIRLQNAAGQARLQVQNLSAGQVNLDFGAFPADVAAKAAIAWDVNNFAASLDGAAVLNDMAGTIPTVNDIHFGFNEGTGNPLNGGIERFVYYPTRINDAGVVLLATP